MYGSISAYLIGHIEDAYRAAAVPVRLGIVIACFNHQTRSTLLQERICRMTRAHP